MFLSHRNIIEACLDDSAASIVTEREDEWLTILLSFLVIQARFTFSFVT